MTSYLLKRKKSVTKQKPNVVFEGSITYNPVDTAIWGFDSTSEYAGVSDTIDFGSCLGYSFTFKVTISNVTQAQWFAGTRNYGFIVGVYNGRWILWSSSNGTSWDVAFQATGTYAVQPNTEYLVQYMFYLGRHILRYSTDGGTTWVNDITIRNSAKVSGVRRLYLGSAWPNDSNGAYTGFWLNGCKAELNVSYTTSSGGTSTMWETIWTGMKEVTEDVQTAYMLQRRDGTKPRTYLLKRK